MTRATLVLLVLSSLSAGAPAAVSSPIAWPQRARLTSLDGQPVRFRVYSLGGDLVVTRTAPGGGRGSAMPEPAILAVGDTLRGITPADFPLDLSKGPVVFLAEGSDSLHLVVGWNPNGSVRAMSRTGRGFRARLDSGLLVIDVP